MVWFFERSSDVIELITRYENVTAEFVLEVRTPGEPARTERFSTAATFRRRLQGIRRELGSDRWESKGAPAMLPRGWDKAEQ
jgi:hypothetical protein